MYSKPFVALSGSEVDGEIKPPYFLILKEVEDKVLQSCFWCLTERVLLSHIKRP
jgi:hypothetical protein